MKISELTSAQLGELSKLVALKEKLQGEQQKLQAELDAVMEITRTADCREGIRAFLDKRQPSYRGPGYGDLGNGR